MLTCVVLAGCQDSSSDPADEAVPGGGSPSDASLVLASRSTHGGLCASGDECSAEVSVRGDGHWTSVTEGRTTRGVLDADDVDTLRTAIGQTRLEDAAPASGCATASDGSEVIYAWRSEAGGLVEVSSCERSIPEADPLVTWFADFEAAG